MSFDIALSGLNAINSSLDTISNNIANSGTYGFKSSRANFASVYAGSQPSGATIGSVTQSISKGGNVQTTGRGMDAAINGRGFFVSRDASGAEVFSRVGIFSMDKEGFVVDSAGRKVQGYGVQAAGAALGALGDLKVPQGQIPATASNRLSYVGNLSSDWTTPSVAVFDPANTQSFNSATVSVVYDSLGTRHSLTQYFIHSASNQVTVRYTFDGAVLPASTTLNFSSAGKLTAPAAPVALALGTPAGAAALSVNVDYTGTTQFAGEATTTVNSSNGYASGILTGVQIEQNGGVMAQYSNGEKQQVGTIALAAFPSEDALSPVSDTAWTTSNASGTPLFFTPGGGMVGDLTVGAIEQSNVDVTRELVGLMTSQRNYQANSKVISTENQMMQALMQAM